MQIIQKANPIANRRQILMAYHDSRMLSAIRCHLYIVVIMGTEHTTHLGCALEMIFVRLTKRSEVADINDIYATSAQLFCNSGLYIFIKIKTNRIVQHFYPLLRESGGFRAHNRRRLLPDWQSNKQAQRRPAA